MADGTGYIDRSHVQRCTESFSAASRSMGLYIDHPKMMANEQFEAKLVLSDMESAYYELESLVRHALEDDSTNASSHDEDGSSGNQDC